MSDATPEEADEPSYTQLGEDGNPFSKDPVTDDGSAVKGDKAEDQP